MKLVTVSGSIYELDLAARKVRRLEGKGPPTSRMGADGEWTGYLDVSFPRVGSGILVTWSYEDDPVDGPFRKTTLTSNVLTIDESQEDKEFLIQMALSLGQSQNENLC